tara:strand:+ start:651 stop:863 length:213 start_codon:yes stop_codon:yes gene_type:complete
MGYIIHDTKLEHDGGAHNLEVEIDDDQAVIRFGSSFTLRLNENQLDNLRDILYETTRELVLTKMNPDYRE